MKKMIVLLAATLTLSACGDKTYSVQDFLKDKNLMNEMIKKCRSGELHAESTNCTNAIRASRLG